METRGAPRFLSRMRRKLSARVAPRHTEPASESTRNQWVCSLFRGSWVDRGGRDWPAARLRRAAIIGPPCALIAKTEFRLRNIQTKRISGGAGAGYHTLSPRDIASCDDPLGDFTHAAAGQPRPASAFSPPRVSVHSHHLTPSSHFHERPDRWRPASAVEYLKPPLPA